MVSIASSSANTPGQLLLHAPLGNDRTGLNRFFVSEYSRTVRRRRMGYRLTESQSLLRQRILPDNVNILEACKAGIMSQSLLRQRILPDHFGDKRNRQLVERLNRFFVSESSRTLQRLNSLRTDDHVSIASSSANTPGRRGP